MAVYQDKARERVSRSLRKHKSVAQDPHADGAKDEQHGRRRSTKIVAAIAGGAVLLIAVMFGLSLVSTTRDSANLAQYSDAKASLARGDYVAAKESFDALPTDYRDVAIYKMAVQRMGVYEESEIGFPAVVVVPVVGSNGVDVAFISDHFTDDKAYTILGSCGAEEESCELALDSGTQDGRATWESDGSLTLWIGEWTLGSHTFDAHEESLSKVSEDPGSRFDVSEVIQ